MGKAKFKILFSFCWELENIDRIEIGSFGVCNAIEMKTSGSECEKTIFKGIYCESDIRQNIRQEGKKLKLVDITMKPPSSFLTLRKTFYDILCLNMQIRHYPMNVRTLAFILSDKARFKILVLFCWQTRVNGFYGGNFRYFFWSLDKSENNVNSNIKPFFFYFFTMFLKINSL